MSVQEAACRITLLRRAPEGHWTANVTPEGGETTAVHHRYGSWMVDVPETDQMREVVAPFNLRLAEAVRTRETRERKAQAEALDTGMLPPDEDDE